MRARRGWAAVALVMCAACAAELSCAAQVRVAGGGPPARGGRVLRVRPTQSLGEALRAARPGDVVLLARGVYDGDVWVDAAGAPGRPITVRAAEGLGSVVLRGGGETLNIGDGAHDLVFEGLELRDSGDNLVHIQGGAHDIVLRDLRVHDAGDDGDGIKVNQAHDIVIERVECYHPGRRPDRPDDNPAQECIDLLDVAHAVVQDCYLHDGGNMLLYAKGASRDVVFQRNVIVGQGPDAIDPCVGVGASSDVELLRGRPYEAENVVVRNNLVAGCRAGAVGVYDAHRVWIVNNTLLDTGPDVLQFRAGSGPRGESRDVHVVNNVVADSRGAMQRAVALLSHRVAELEVRNNLYWNGGRPVPADGLADPNRDASSVCADPALAGMPEPHGDRAAYMRQASLGARSAAVDRGVTLQGPGAVTDDLFRRQRPNGRAIDLGAVEFGAAMSVEAGTLREPWPSEAPPVAAVFNVLAADADGGVVTDATFGRIFAKPVRTWWSVAAAGAAVVTVALALALGRATFRPPRAS